jgi:hypothetical protein
MRKGAAVYRFKSDKYAGASSLPDRDGEVTLRGQHFAQDAQDISNNEALHIIFDAHDRKPSQTGEESALGVTYQEGITG